MSSMSLKGEEPIEDKPSSLLDEINDKVRPSSSLTRRIAKIYPTIDFDSGAPVVLPVARSVETWRSPSEWKIKASPNGGRILKTEMRSLALIATEGLEGAMLDFVEEHRIALSRFSLVTTASLRPKIKKLLGFKALILGSDDNVSDKRGGLALLQARIVLESIGGAVIFNDGLSAAFAGDFASTFRLLNVQDVMVATNRASADAMMHVLDDMVTNREPELMPCFFVTLQSPAVPAYKKQQNALIESLKGGGKTAAAREPLKESGENAENATAAAKTPGSAMMAARSMKAQLNSALDPVAELGESSESFKRQLTRQMSASKLAPATPTGRRRLSNASGDAIGRSAQPAITREPSIGSEAGEGGLETMIPREEMRCLALISHNNMKEEMRKFVHAHKDVLRCFRLTGTASTMKMLADVLGTDDLGGFECSSGPLGGDAQVGAFICLEQIGGVIFFTDPLSAHPHQADVDFLHRVINQHSVVHATNPSGAHAIITVLERAVRDGKRELIPSFFETQAKKALNCDLRMHIGAMRWAKRAKSRRSSRESLTDSDDVADDTTSGRAAVVDAKLVKAATRAAAGASAAADGASAGVLGLTKQQATTAAVVVAAVVTAQIAVSLLTGASRRH